MIEFVSNINELTPVEKVDNLYFKRDDYFKVANSRGGKARTCFYLSRRSKKGLVTAGSRQSPQVNLVASMASYLGIEARIHTPQGELSPEVQAAVTKGAILTQHKAGYNSVIRKRAEDDAKLNKMTEIPFGMECFEAVEMTKKQVINIPKCAKRIVVPVGSGMSLAGILTGLKENKIKIPVLGVVVGASPIKRLEKYAPFYWQNMVELVNAGVDYHKVIENNVINGVTLDPIYEAKCIPFLQDGDCLWIVGIRETAVK